MSRLTGNDARSLMEAYAAVYAPQINEEQVWEEVESWVNSLLEEGYDLSDYTWEDMYESYIEEQNRRGGNRDRGTGFGTPSQIAGRVSQSLSTQQVRGRSGAARAASTAAAPAAASTAVDRPGGGIAGGVRPASAPGGVRPGGGIAGGVRPASAPGGVRPGGGIAGGVRPAAPAAAARPSAAPTSAKPAPAAPAGQTGDKAKDMDTWAKANPKLAAAAAERERTRGTQQTDNPLMKDFRSRLPMNSPSVQSPDVTKLGSGNQSLTQNPNALKSAPEKPTPTATPTPTTSFKTTSSPKVSSLSKEAAKRPPAFQANHYDPFDVVVGHLLDEGYADTEEAAVAIMANMSEEWIQTILSEDPIQNFRDMVRAKENVAGMRGPELRHSGAASTTKPKPSGLVDVSTAEKAAKNLPGSRVYMQRQQGIK
jgi:hypothetical protein